MHAKTYARLTLLQATLCRRVNLKAKTVLDMAIFIKISSTLREYVPDYQPSRGLWYEPANLHSPYTAASLAESIGIPLPEIKFAMINGRQLPMDSVLKDGDRVAYFPAVGGG